MSDKTSQPTKTAVVTSDTISILIVLAIVITVNVLVSQFGSFRADLTEEKLYTLSNGTKTLIKDLEQPITLKYYFTKSGATTPMGLKQYGQRILDLLKEYKTHGGGNVILEVSDPKPDSDEEEWAQKYGVSGQSLNPLGGGEAFYLGLVASSGKKEAVIPFLSPNAEPQLEYLVTRLIYEASLAERPKLGVLSGLPVMGGPPQMPFQQPRGPQPQKWAFVRELESTYEVEELRPPFDSVPEEIDTLLVIHPKNLQDEALFALDQFLLRGGRLLVFQDPMSMAEQETSPQPNQFGFGTSSDLNKLSRAWGIEMLPSKIAGDLQAATQISRGQGQVDRSIVWLSLRGNQIDRTDTAFSSLEFLMMPMAGYFTGEPKEGLTMTKLITTSSDSGTMDTFSAMQPSNQAIKNMQREGNLPLAVRLQGKFKTAFPDGKPSSSDSSEPPEGEGDKPEYLKESKENSVVVMIADVDMIYDRFCVQVMNFFGQQIQQPTNDNLPLLQNLVEQVSGSEAMIGLRSRGTFQRPFHKVIELEKAAQAKFQEQEQVLQEKLEQTQQRLSELQAAKKQEQKLMLSPEQEAEIKKFREQQFDTRKQLKVVRKELRRDIDRLGSQLKAINIAMIPALFGIFGIIKAVIRRNPAVYRP